MPDCGVHYLWFAFVCFLIRSPPPPPKRGQRQTMASCPPPPKKEPRPLHTLMTISPANCFFFCAPPTALQPPCIPAGGPPPHRSSNGQSPLWQPLLTAPPSPSNARSLRPSTSVRTLSPKILSCNWGSWTGCASCIRSGCSTTPRTPRSGSSTHYWRTAWRSPQGPGVVPVALIDVPVRVRVSLSEDLVFCVGAEPHSSFTALTQSTPPPPLSHHGVMPNPPPPPPQNRGPLSPIQPDLSAGFSGLPD